MERSLRPCHQRRHRQSGNVFLTLFALLAAAGIIGGTTMSILRGPVAGNAQISKYKIADTAMQAAARLIGAAGGPSTDCDGDGTLEPIAWQDAAGQPAVSGGGILPASLGAAKTDPWGGAYSYCAWDYGTQTVTDDVAGCGGGGANRIVGATLRTEPVIAIISAGPDKRFDTTCSAFVDANTDNVPDKPLVARAQGSDDRIHLETLDTLLKIGGDTRLPAYPDEACTPDVLGLMRLDMDTVQVCTEDGWEEVGASVAADDVFVPVTGAEPSSLQSSNPITFSGYFGTRTATVDNGAVIVVNGSVQGATAQIAAADSVVLRANAAATPATLATFTLALGAIQRSWNVTTRNPTPPALTIQPTTQSGMDVAGPGNPAYGATVSFLVRNTGETPTTLSASLLSNAVSFAFSSGGMDVGDDCNGKTLAHNQTCVLDVRPQASNDGAYSGTVTATDGTLNAIASLAGTATGWACTVAAGTTWSVGVNTCVVPVTLNIAHGATAVANDSTNPVTGSATYGCSSGTATVQAGATCNALPDAFSFNDLTVQPRSTLIASNIIIITGITAPTAVSVSGTGSPQISINGGGWVTSGTISNGQTLQVRLTSSGSSSTTHSATVDVGGVTDIWSVQTGAPCTGTPWGMLSHGAVVTGYAAASVPCESSCTSETRTCHNGNLSGSYANTGCTPAACANCTVPAGHTWTVSGKTCTNPTVRNITHGSTGSATDSTAPTTGSATWGCNNGSYSLQAGATCVASCTVNAGTTWTVGGNSCTVSSSFSIAHGASAGTTDSTAPTTGSAIYACTNGTPTLQAGATCNTAVTCGAFQINQQCSGGTALGSTGTSDPTLCTQFCQTHSTATCCLRNVNGNSCAAYSGATLAPVSPMWGMHAASCN